MFEKAPQEVGLTTAQIQHIRRQQEQTALPLRSSRSYLQIVRANVVNLYNIILIASALLVIILGGSKDVLFAILLVCANIGIGLFQEIRAKRALDKLATLSKHTVTVRRDGQKQVIALNELVTGDAVEIFPGEPIVADGKVLFSDSLELNEAALTGESESQPKEVGEMLTSGSYCSAGFGIMRAEKVGKQSSLYSLTQKAKIFRTTQTNSERWLKKLFQGLILIIVVLAPLTFISGINQGFTFSETLTNVINLVSSLVPQGMIISMTILFAYGIVSISKYHTLVQRVNAVAVMGTISVLCADKTGTLTTNELSVERIIPIEKFPLNEVKRKLAMFTKHVSWANKTAQAIAEYVSAVRLSDEKNTKVAEVPFVSDRKWGGIQVVSETLVLGAPEVLTNDPEILNRAQQCARDGYRVLAFAVTQLDLPKNTKHVALPAELKVIALIALRDHLRTDVRATLGFLAKQHITFKVISGDSSETLRSIAAQLKLPVNQVFDQGMLENADVDSFALMVRQGQFFARISPEMKERIVVELVRQGEFVAMLGDGVNDVQAMKKAHVAIAVNDGSQVTKDIADIILLNNSFTSLPKAIEEGRDITQRVYAVGKIFFVKVVYLITLFLLAGFASFGFPISLRQTTWLSFIMVGVPTALISFKILRPSATKNLEKGLINYTLTAGVIGGVFMAALMVFSQLILHEDLDASRTKISLFASVFGTFVLLQVHGINIFSYHSMRRHFGSFLIILVIGLIALLFPSQFTPNFFKSAQLDHTDWLVVAFGVGASILYLRVLSKKIPFIPLIKKWMG